MNNASALELERATVDALLSMQVQRRMTITALAQHIGINRETLRRGLHGRRIWWVNVKRIDNWLLAEQGQQGNGGETPRLLNRLRRPAKEPESVGAR